MQRTQGGGTRPHPGDRDDMLSRDRCGPRRSAGARPGRALTLIEQAVAGEMSASEEQIAADVIVLDDVTPGYAKARRRCGHAMQALALPCICCRSPWPRRMRRRRRAPA